MENVKSYNFSSITFSDLRKIVSISPLINDAKFEDWFTFSYPISNEEAKFLEKLIQKHRLLLPFYQEDTLKVKFIGAILNQVDFSGIIQDWYHAGFSGKINDIYFNGFVDLLIAKGIYEPEKPYFFIQEFKPSKPDRDPEAQLLAEMLVAIEQNQTTKFYGAYIIGQYWKFVILEKIAENNFEYFVSESFDSLKIKDLKQIYVNLQAVKLKYCVD